MTSPIRLPVPQKADNSAFDW